jgi:hypothetical protein
MWGCVGGLFCGSLVTLIGVLSSLEPDTIAGRSAIAAGVTGIFTHLIALGVRSISVSDEPEE